MIKLSKAVADPLVVASLGPPSPDGAGRAAYVIRPLLGHAAAAPPSSVMNSRRLMLISPD